MKIMKSSGGGCSSSVSYNEAKNKLSMSDISDIKRSDLGDRFQANTTAGEFLYSSVSPVKSNIYQTVKSLNTYSQPKDSRVVNRFNHFKVSWHPDDKLSNREMRNVCREVMDELGYGDCAMRIYRHHDEPHPHAHIVVSRVRPDNKTVRDSFDGLKRKVLERDLSEKYGYVIPEKQSIRDGVRQETFYEKKKMDHRLAVNAEGKLIRDADNKVVYEEDKQSISLKNHIKGAVDKALLKSESAGKKISFTDFQAFLNRENVGIKTRPYYGRNEKGEKVKKHGLSYFIKDTDKVLKFNSPVVSKELSDGLNEHLQQKRDLKSVPELGNARFSLDIHNLVYKNEQGYKSVDFAGYDDYVQKYSSQKKYDSFCVKASSLGPRYQMENLLDSVSVSSNELSESAVKEFESPYSAVNDKLALALEADSDVAVMEAIEEGAEFSQLSSVEQLLYQQRLNQMLSATSISPSAKEEKDEEMSPEERFNYYVQLHEEKYGAPTYATRKMIALYTFDQLEEINDVINLGSHWANRGSSGLTSGQVNNQLADVRALPDEVWKELFERDKDTERIYDIAMRNINNPYFKHVNRNFIEKGEDNVIINHLELMKRYSGMAEDVINEYPDLDIRKYGYKREDFKFSDPYVEEKLCKNMGIDYWKERQEMYRAAQEFNESQNHGAKGYLMDNKNEMSRGQDNILDQQKRNENRRDRGIGD